MDIVYGPVPSRRLGRSLGINNIPPKICTYACVYCQLGRTPTMRVERRAFYHPDEILERVRTKLAHVRSAGDVVDFLTLVPDGEPTLDINLAVEIRGLRDTGVPVGVISNASLIWREDVRQDLAHADWVSLKVDAVHTDAWRAVSRPHGTLVLDQILTGIRDFRDGFHGRLVTETMLVAGINDGDEAIRDTAAFLGTIEPEVAYIAVPTRPPAEPWAAAPHEAILHRAHQHFGAHVDRVELLIGYEGNEFAASGNAEGDLLSITAVHPMRKDAVERLLTRDNATWEVVERLVAEGKLAEIPYEETRYYLRHVSTTP